VQAAHNGSAVHCLAQQAAGELVEIAGFIDTDMESPEDTLLIEDAFNIMTLSLLRLIRNAHGESMIQAARGVAA
jgi:hypothetical protein